MEPQEDGPFVRPPNMVGRGRELGAISTCVEGCLAGKFRCVLLSGEPGIGKTRLAQEASALAADRGALAIWARWHEGEKYPEYWVWRQLLGELFRAKPRLLSRGALDQALSELSVILPDIRERRPRLASPYRTRARQTRLRLFGAVRRIVERAAVTVPIVFVLDNLHLAGEASMALLSILLEELPETRFLVVATFRSLEVDVTPQLRRFLAAARTSDRVAELPLLGIDLKETEVLVRDLTGGRADPETLQNLNRITGGNPLYVREAARLLIIAAQPGSKINGSLWNIEVPRAMDTLIVRRFARLSRDCARFLPRAAVAGERFSFEEAAAIEPGVSETTLEAVLTEAVSHGFVREVTPGQDYRFSHDVVRCALQIHISRREQQQAAEELARAMEKRIAEDPAFWAHRIAGWYAQTGSSQGQEAFRRYTRMAADMAIESGAWEEAIELYGELVDADSSEVHSQEEAELLFGIGRAYTLSGDWPAAAKRFSTAISYYQGAGDLEHMIAIATQPGYLRAGEPGFFDFYKEILPLLPAGSLLEAQVLHFYGIAQFNSLGNYARAEEMLTRSLEVAVKEGDPILQKNCLTALAYLDNTFHRFDDATRKCQQALAIAVEHPEPYGDTHAWFVRSCTLRLTGRAAESHAYVDRTLEQARLLRNGDLLANAQHERAGLMMLEGRWQDARHAIDEGLAVCPEHLILLATRTFLEYTTGDTRCGDQYRERVLAIHHSTAPGPYHAHIHAVSTAAVRARSTGDLHELSDWIPLLRSIATFVDCHPFIRLRVHLLLAFIAAQLADLELAREQYDAVLSLPRLHLIRPYLTERFLGLAAHCFGDHRKAVKHLERARVMASEYGDLPLGAWIACELGEALSPSEVGLCVPDEARRLLLAAIETAKGLGMRPLYERAAARLQALTESDAEFPPFDLHLSSREREVLELVAEGLPNDTIAGQLSISVNTVANHVRNILCKTRTRNRTEAVHFARRIGIIR